MRILCINDDFSGIENEVLKKLYAENRDEYFPKKGLVYDVDVYVIRNERESYTLKDLKSTEEFGVKLSFLKERFIITDDFIPEGTNEAGYEYATLKMDFELVLDWSKLPADKHEKLMADFKEPITFVHDGTDKTEEIKQDNEEDTP
ncbi:unnamed protein product [Sphagnum balticum]